MIKRIALLLFLFLSVASKAQENTELLIVNRVDHLSTLAREPMLAQHPSGALFVTGYRNQSEEPQLWRSDDMGKNWVSVNVGQFEDGAQGNSDADLHIDKEGNIYLLSMTYSRLPQDVDLTDFDMSTLIGEQVVVGVSRDIGKTWNWHFISQNDYDDRPWIAESSNGDIHIIWNDGGVHHSKSSDNGESWTKQPSINAKGGSSFLATGPNGEIAVRVSPLSASAHKMDEGIDLIRLSLDNGKTWNDVKLPGNVTWTQDFTGFPRWTEPLAFDDNGNLYAAWSEGTELKLAISSDQGKNWETHSIYKNEGQVYYPYMEIKGEHIMMTWNSGFGEALVHEAAVIHMKDGKPLVHRIPAQKLDLRSRYADGINQMATGGEYFPIMQLANGNFGMATTIQNQVSNRLGFTFWELTLSTY